MSNCQKPFGGISGSTLKLIAILTMFIDHAGATVILAIVNHPYITADASRLALWRDIYRISRQIGRIAFPIFCFLLVEGFVHTRNVKKYAARLFLFALISEIPFDLALKGNWYYPDKQNVYFTLLIGLLVLWGISFFEQRFGPGKYRTDQDSDALHARPVNARAFASGLLFLLPSVLILAAGMYVALKIDTDYNYKGVFLIAILYLLRHTRLYQCAGGAAATSWELPASLAFLPVYLYNGSRGLRMKYFFYWFYPVHLLVLHVIADYLIPGIGG